MTVAKLDTQLCFALYSASSQLTSVYRELLEPLNLTYTQFIVLMALWEKDHIPISELAYKAGLGKATMTPLLKRLEQKKLINRKTLSSNERQKMITLTESGRKLSQHSMDITEQAFCATGLSKKQANDMIEHCHAVVARIKNTKA